MKMTELKKKKTDDLKKVVLDGKKELLNLRFQQTTGQLKNIARAKAVRRTIARAKTLMRAAVSETKKA